MNFQPRVGVSWDPKGDGRTSVRAGYGMNGDFVAGQFFFDASQAPPFGYEERLTRPAVGRFDDPFGGDRPDQSVPGRRLAPTRRSGPAALYIQVPHDLKTTRVHSWNVGGAASDRRQPGGVGDLPRQPHDERLGRRHREPRHASRGGGGDRPVHAARRRPARRHLPIAPRRR